MKNVVRVDIPTSLANNHEKWTQDLLDEISRREKDGEKVEDKYYEKYRKQDIREALIQMYDNHCCYCESRLGIVDYQHIEHLKPKKKYPNHTYSWDNLHLACTKCNNHKLDKYDEQHPILDPVVDIPISEHLTYKFIGEGIARYPLSERGKTTIDHTDLDRNYLRVSRLEVWAKTFNLIVEINNKPNHFAIDFVKEELDSLRYGQYGSLVDFIIEHFLDSQNAN